MRTYENADYREVCKRLAVRPLEIERDGTLSLHGQTRFMTFNDAGYWDGGWVTYRMDGWMVIATPESTAKRREAAGGVE